MPAEAMTEPQCAEVSRLIADTLGLHFPPEQWADLQRGLTEVAADLGCRDSAECAGRLLATPPTPAQVRTLAAHLTIGETYFFREKALFEVLETRVLPELIAARRAEGRLMLRFWSAGCCTGEEPYSLAILLRRLLPDFERWRVTLLATDINAGFLRKAAAGIYGEWSFRDAPADLRSRWFRREGVNRHALVPTIRDMVTFAPLNLARDDYPSLATDTHAMDLIFCRNVLMYFTAERVARVVGNFHCALAEGGLLAISPSEASHELFPGFAARNFPGVILYGKNREASCSEQPLACADLTTAMETAVSSPYPEPVRFSSAEEPSPAPECTPTPAGVDRELEQARDFSKLARAEADRGRLPEALSACERWLAADKLDPAAHHLRAMVLMERGETADARAALQRAVYLDPEFVSAHFALGNLARRAGATAEMERHFANTRRLLARLPSDAILPEADGLTAGGLLETLDALSAPNPTT